VRSKILKLTKTHFSNGNRFFYLHLKGNQQKQTINFKHNHINFLNWRLCLP